MLSVKGSASGGGGGGKKKLKGGKQSVKKEAEMLSKELGSSLLVLRRAIYDEYGVDRDVLKDFSALAKYKKNGLNVHITFHALPLPRRLLSFALKTTRQNMAQLYDEAGYGWDDYEKKDELKGQGARYLFFRTPKPSDDPDNASSSGRRDELLGFAHFRFTSQGEFFEKVGGEPTLYLYDLQLVPSAQGKGVGSYVMGLLELIARKTNMSYFMAAAIQGSVASAKLLASKGFELDAEFNIVGDSQQIYSKRMFGPKKIVQKAKSAASVQAPASDTAGKKKRKRKKKKKKKKKNTNEDDVKTGDAPDASLPAPSTQAGGGPSTASPTGSNSTAINQTFQVLKQKPRTFAQKMMNPHGDFKMSFSLDKPLVFKDDAGATKKPATAAAGSLTAKDKAKPFFSFDASSLKFGKK